MNIFKGLFFSLVCLSATQSYAQDMIYTRAGSTYQAKIKSVGGGFVVYKKWDNQTGPDYTLAIEDVMKIKYENGNEEQFVTEGSPASSIAPAGFRNGNTSPMPGLGKTIYSLSPMQFTENGVGLSIAYEKILDKEGVVAFYMPLAATFNLNSSADNKEHQDAMFYLMPGIKFYPTSQYGKTKYAIGPSMIFGLGQKTTVSTNYSQSSVTYDYLTRDKVMLGILVNNSVNINATQHFYLGFDFGFGFTYINKLNGENQGVNGTVQGNFRIGYRK